MFEEPGWRPSGGLRKGWALTLALVALAAGLSCSFATSVLSRTPQAAAGNVPLGLIAYVGVDANIYTIQRDGSHPIPITQDANLNPAADTGPRIYQYPTWAPDGRTLAYMRFSRIDLSGPEVGLYAASSDGKRHVQVFNSQESFPFYLFWSPNSRTITFLSNSSAGDELALYMAAASGSDSQFISSGQPFYWDWSPDSQVILGHIGGAASDNPDARLAFFRLDGKVKKEELALKPGTFQAPAWSPNGDELILSTQTDEGKEQLILAGKDGALQRVLAETSGPVAFAWSPDGRSLAYTSQLVDDPNGASTRLEVLDPAQPDRASEAARGTILAYFWSPDSRKIATLSIGSDNPGGLSKEIVQKTQGVSLNVQVIDLSSGKSQHAATFSPTDSFQQILPFFDQYQRSGTIWSPDSQQLVLSGVDQNGHPGIYVVSADGGAARKIADGDFAFWSWK
jgi:Tol biopolymer transport system component